MVLDAGRALAWFDTRSGNLVPFPAATGRGLSALVAALASLGKDGRVRSVEIRKVNGQPLADYDKRDELTDELRTAGFADGYRGFVLR